MNALTIVHEEWILFPDKLIVKSLAWMDKLNFWKNINIYLQ